MRWFHMCFLALLAAASMLTACTAPHSSLNDPIYQQVMERPDLYAPQASYSVVPDAGTQQLSAFSTGKMISN